MDALTYEFMQRALIAALLVGLTAPAVGVYLVQRRLALIGDGMGHVALTGVALGLLTGNLRAGARIKLKACGLPDFFPDGGFGEDGPDRPSLGRIAHRRCERLLGADIPPGQYVLVVHQLCDVGGVGTSTGTVDARLLLEGAAPRVPAVTVVGLAALAALLLAAWGAFVLRRRAEEYLPRLYAVNAESVLEAAAVYLTPERLGMTLIVPAGRAAELQGLEELLHVVRRFRQYDRNQNWQLEDDELAEAKERLSAFSVRYNEGLLRNFDKDGDGTLGDEEIVQARKEIEAQKALREERRKTGGGGRGPRR